MEDGHEQAGLDVEGGDRERARKLVAVGGGRGGVGKSVIAQSLAVYFAQLGKPVVLVDADPTGTNLHAHFGLRASVREPKLGSGALAEFARALVQTSVPGLRLLPAAHDAINPPQALRAGRKARWLARVRSLPAEYVVVDVGPGHGPVAVDLMLAADFAVAVTVPEPPAIEATYRFLRAAYVRRVRRALTSDRFRLGIFERALAQLGSLPAPVELVRALARMDRQLAELAWSETNRLRMHLVVNQTRVRSDLELGNWMCDLAQRHYGIALDELGHIEHDDTVWLTVRRNKPLLVDSPTSKAARNVERIARRVLALLAARQERVLYPTPLPGEDATLYARLGITRSSTDEEVRRAYKRVKEIYASGGLATSSLLTEDELNVQRAKLDEAYDTLLIPCAAAHTICRRSPRRHPPTSSRCRRDRRSRRSKRCSRGSSREIGPDTEFTGALLRKVRESQGVELKEICERTKIAKGHLAAIEEEHWASLPALVYVRGFVSEIAKFLKLDPPQVQRTYLRRMRDGLTTRGKGVP